jgi:hypothetical protein
MDYMGDGWSFKFDRIKKDTDTSEEILKLSNGASYRYKNGVSPSNLKNYSLTDLKLEIADNEYLNSKYKLTFKDGKKEYFDSQGKLIGMRDRFNNTINFQYNAGSGYNGSIVITDSNSNIVNISYTPSLVTVTLPDQGVIRYTLQALTKGKVISQKQDQLNQVTAFTYSAQNAEFNYFSKNTSASGKESVTYNLLTGAAYPTGASSQYVYGTAVSNTLFTDFAAGIFKGFAQYCRLTSRKDSSDSSVYNREQYAYSENNFSGYPSNDHDMDSLAVIFIYSTTVSWDDNTSRVYTFNNKHLNTIDGIYLNSVIKKKKTFEYDANKQPSSVTHQTYGAATQTAAELFTYATDIIGLN